MMAILDGIRKILKYRFNLNEDKADELEIVEGIKRGVEFKGVNLWTLIFAIFIASIGLNTNSTAVIIGAMLISPLMGPIMGIGLGAAILDTDLIIKAAKNLGFAVVISLITSSVYFLISPLNEAKSELLARTYPTIWDVLIALFGGLTGIIAGSRKNVSNAIPGVAIATALMPPLCTAGFGLASGNIAYLLGAFYLFLINCFFICLSTFWIIRLLKFKRTVNYINPISVLIKRIIYITSFALIAPSLYFGFLMVKQEIFVKNVTGFISGEITGDYILVVNKEIDAVNESARIVLMADGLSEDEINRIKKRKKKYGLEKSEIEITTTRSAATLQQKDYSLVVSELFTTNKSNLKRKDSIIAILKNEKEVADGFRIDERALLKEFIVLFGKPQHFSVSKTLIFDESYNPQDTIVIMYLKPSGECGDLPLAKIEQWLNARLDCKRSKVIYEEYER